MACIARFAEIQRFGHCLRVRASSTLKRNEWKGNAAALAKHETPFDVGVRRSTNWLMVVTGDFVIRSRPERLNTAAGQDTISQLY